jgi:hypothetical protein
MTEAPAQTSFSSDLIAALTDLQAQDGTEAAYRFAASNIGSDDAVSRPFHRPHGRPDRPLVGSQRNGR